MKTKACTKCKIEKELSEFRKHKWSNDGYLYCCKQCEKIYQREYRLKNKERAKLYNKEYYRILVQNNPEKIKRRKLYGAEWSKNNRGKRRASLAKWRKNNLEKINSISRERMAKKIFELKDSYIKLQLRSKGYPNELITSGLIEIQRLIIKTKRIIKTKQYDNKN